MMGGMEELIMRMPTGQRQEKRRVRVLEVRVPLMWMARNTLPQKSSCKHKIDVETHHEFRSFPETMGFPHLS
jgi:hypothetical protein